MERFNYMAVPWSSNAERTPMPVRFREVGMEQARQWVVDHCSMRYQWYVSREQDTTST